MHRVCLEVLRIKSVSFPAPEQNTGSTVWPLPGGPLPRPWTGAVVRAVGEPGFLPLMPCLALLWGPAPAPPHPPQPPSGCPVSLSLLTAVAGPASGRRHFYFHPTAQNCGGFGFRSREADGRVHSHCAHSGHQPGREGLGRAPVPMSPGLFTDFRVWGWLLEEGLPVLPASQGTKATKSPRRGPR